MIDRSKNEEAFMSYLATKVTPAQLSELYQCYGEIESFCNRMHVLNGSIFEVTDMARLLKIQNAIEHNKFFQVTYKKQAAKIISAWQYYYRYIREGYYLKNEQHSSSDSSKVNSDHTSSKIDLQILVSSKRSDAVDPLYPHNETESPHTGSNSVVHSEEVILILQDKKVQYIDKRIQGGYLWALGGVELTDFFASCKEKGYKFRFTPNGSRVTGYRSGWYLVPGIRANSSEKNEIAELLQSEDLKLLRDELVRQGITTVKALKEVNLWAFMNRSNLYTIAKRQVVLENVQALLNPDTHQDHDKVYVLHAGMSLFTGATPAEAYLSFCEAMAQKYPLRFRTLIGAHMQGSETTPVRNSGVEGHHLKLANLNAYISANRPTSVILYYARWVCDMCGETNTELKMDEPQKSKLRIAPAPTVPPIAPSHPLTSPPILSRDANPKTKKIEQYVLSADMDGVSYDDIKDAINLTLVDTKQFVSEAKRIVDIKGKLIHEDAFVDWEEGSEHLEEIIDKLLKKNSGYISSNQLYEYARAEMNMFLNDNDMNEERSVYDIARHLFEKVDYHGKHLKFYGNVHISLPSDSVSSNFDIIKKYATEQGGLFSFSGLDEYLKSVGIGTGNLRSQMRLYSDPVFFYYEEGIFVAAENLHIDVQWKTSVKSLLMDLFTDVGDHIIMRDIPTTWLDRLPGVSGGCVWTPLLLQSVLRFFGEELGAHTILAMEGQATDTLHAMLVSSESAIQNFGDVIISYITENEVKQCNFEAEELRNMLVSAGILKGNELIWNMPKALKGDGRFAWDAAGSRVTIKVL